MDYKELIERLATDREWAEANEWESPICLQDDLSAAISAITTLMEENAQLRAEILDLEAQHRTEFCEAALYDCVELGKVRAELERGKRERDAAISLLRKINWCAGCIHFKGLKGCADNAMSVCDKENDHYQFVGPQKEE